MKFAKLTFQYLKKSWAPLLLAVLPVSVFLAVFFKPLGTVTFLPDYFQGSVGNFWDIFLMIVSPQIRLIYPPIVVFVLMILGFSFGWSVIHTHFRMGKLMIKEPMRAMNYSLLAVIVCFLTLFLIAFVLHLFESGLLMIQHTLISDTHLPNVYSKIIAAVIATLVGILSLIIIAPLLIFPPVVLAYGYTLGDGLAAAMRIALVVMKKLFVSLMLPSCCIAAVVLILRYLNVFQWIQTILFVPMYCFLLMYILALGMVSVYDAGGLERRDLIKKY